MGRKGGGILCKDARASSEGEGRGLGLLSLEEGRLGYDWRAVRVLLLLECGCGKGALWEGELGGWIGRSELGREAGGRSETGWTLWWLACEVG